MENKPKQVEQPPELTSEDDAILDKVWDDIAAKEKAAEGKTVKLNDGRVINKRNAMAEKEKPNRFIETEPEKYLIVTPPKKKPKTITIKGKKGVIDNKEINEKAGK